MTNPEFQKKKNAELPEKKNDAPCFFGMVKTSYLNHASHLRSNIFSWNFTLPIKIQIMKEVYF